MTESVKQDHDKSAAVRCRPDCDEGRTYVWGDCEAAVEPVREVGPTDTNDLIMSAPELPCPKCGSDDTSLDYCDGCALIPLGSVLGKYPDNKCSHGDPEHFHRRCRRCKYQWRTDDVISARKVCER